MVSPFSSVTDDCGPDGAAIDLATLLDLTADLVQVASPNGLLRQVNRAWHDTLGYAERDILRLLVLDLVHPDHQESMSDTIREVVHQRTPRVHECAGNARW